MRLLTKNEKDEIVQALMQQGANRPCIICGFDKMNIMDGFTPVNINRFAGKKTVQVPLIGTVCQQCGHTNFYSAEMLGLFEMWHKKD